MMRVVVLGAGGRLGREVLRALVPRGHAVCAVVRRPPDRAPESSVQVRLADGRNEAEIREAITGFDAVVNAIGAGTLRRNDVESTTTAVAVAAARAAGVARYIAMSAGMVAIEWPIFKYLLRPLVFRNIVAEHRRVEEIVKASALDWTIVRPPKLTSGSPRGYVASLEWEPGSFSAARADVAAFIADELEANQHVRQAVFVASRRTR
jgi:putative NADH-flavin reductase